MPLFQSAVAEKGWLEHRLCLGEILDPSSAPDETTNMAAELLALKEKMNSLERVKPGSKKSKSKSKKDKKKGDSSVKPKLTQDELLKRLNENIAATCILYNQVSDERKSHSFLVLTFSTFPGALYWVILPQKAPV